MISREASDRKRNRHIPKKKLGSLEPKKNPFSVS